jgi:hypothetical protein
MQIMLELKKEKKDIFYFLLLQNTSYLLTVPKSKSLAPDLVQFNKLLYLYKIISF